MAKYLNKGPSTGILGDEQTRNPHDTTESDKVYGVKSKSKSKKRTTKDV